MGLFWPWVGVIYWMILPFGKYAALSAGFFVACSLFVFLFAFVNSLLSPPPYEPSWIWAASILIGPLIGWIIVFLSNQSSFSTGLFLYPQQLTSLYYGVVFATGTAWILLAFVDGRKHAPWYGRWLPEDFSGYNVTGIFVSVFLLLFSLVILKKPIITTPGVFEWELVVFIIKVFCLQGLSLACIFGAFVLNMNGYKPE
jgi:hypothetical protein